MFVSEPVTVTVRAGDVEWGRPQSPYPPSLREAYDWPKKYMFDLGDGLLVLFTYPDTIVDWDKWATVYHVPSDSEGMVLPDQRTRIDRDRGTEAGRARIEQALADWYFVRQIAERIEEIWRR